MAAWVGNHVGTLKRRTLGTYLLYNLQYESLSESAKKESRKGGKRCKTGKEEETSSTSKPGHTYLSSNGQSNVHV